MLPSSAIGDTDTEGIYNFNSYGDPDSNAVDVDDDDDDVDTDSDGIRIDNVVFDTDTYADTYTNVIAGNVIDTPSRLADAVHR